MSSRIHCFYGAVTSGLRTTPFGNGIQLNCVIVCVDRYFFNTQIIAYNKKRI